MKLMNVNFDFLGCICRPFTRVDMSVLFLRYVLSLGVSVVSERCKLSEGWCYRDAFAV